MFRPLLDLHQHNSISERMMNVSAKLRPTVTAIRSLLHPKPESEERKKYNQKKKECSGVTTVKIVRKNTYSSLILMHINFSFFILIA